ncbi:MAG: TIR domain-containing protein, partial [Terriglobia bacterium]
MAKTFISYNRQDIETVKTLAKDLHDLGHSVWFDQDITGGQPWWNKILANVRECEIFVFALTPASLASHACMQELGYSHNLGKSILPILLSDKVNVSRLPSPLNEIQLLDYRRQDKDAFKGLDKAIKSLPSPEPLPDPLPDPPPIPVSYLSTLREKIETTKLLSLEDQVGLVFKLKNRLEEDHFQQEADELRELLLRLRQRDDLLAKVAKDLDLVMARIDENLSPLALDRGGKPPQISVRPAAAGQEARRRVEQITAEVEVGKVYEGRVAKRTEFVHTKEVHSVAFSPDGTLLASGQGGAIFGFGSVVRLWRVSDGTSLRTLAGHSSWVRSVAFSPDGSMLASGGVDKTVR